MTNRQRLQAFLQSEATGGALLIGAGLVGFFLANGPLSTAFLGFASTEIGIEAIHLNLTIQEWTADGLLAIFFFVIGCELKHELVSGTLSKPRQAVLPVAAAIGGMAVPAAIYFAINVGGPADALNGWGIPMATDIAFALAVLAVIGRGLPSGVRVFLLTLAIVDDLGAILVIALFYSSGLNVVWMVASAILLAAFALAQRQRLTTPLVYVPLALATWYSIHEAGIHATIAGVALGMLMRAKRDSHENDAPVDRAISRFHPISAVIAVPLFAFFAAAVDLRSIDLGVVLGSPVLLGVLVGLVVGKPVGILLAARLATSLGARLAPGVQWIDVALIGAVAGIGFTVSLLISQLAFTTQDALSAAKLGVLLASLGAVALSGAILALRGRRRPNHQ
ncbi:MAG: Na+/H+ antiporter NhaA [Candidatus Limnocylindrus sp.]